MRAFGGKLTCLNLACGLSLIALSPGCGDDSSGEDSASTTAETSSESGTSGDGDDSGDGDATGDGDSGDGDGDATGDGDSGDGDGEMSLPDDPERDWYIWKQGVDDEFVNGLAAVSDGVIVVSTRPHSSGELGTEGVVTKFDSDGAEVWEQIIDSDVPCGSNCSMSTDVTVTDGGEIFVSGALRDSTTLRVDALVATFAADGTPGWTQTFSGTQDDGLDDYNDVAVDPADGSIYAVGAWENDNLFDGMLRKYDSSGTELWDVQINGAATASSDSLNGVEVASNGDVVVTGRQEAAGLEGADQLVVARYDSDGNELWMDVHDENASLFDSGSSVAMDGSGNAFVVGTVDSGNLERHDIWFASYDAGGSQNWAHKYDGEATGDCEASTITCDFGSDGVVLADGNFALAGGVHSTKTDRGAFIAIFDGSGSVLWERMVEGEEDERDSARAISEAPGGGSIYVGGFLTTTNGDTAGEDFFLAKYTPSY
jgi:hypothetical protein